MTATGQHTGTPLPDGIQRGGHRRHQYPRRTKQIVVRLSTDEYESLAAAAARVELTPTGYAAEAALAAARDQTRPTSSDEGEDDAQARMPVGVTRAELAQLQRELFAARTAATKVGTNLNQAVTVLNALGRPPTWLDDAAARCHQVIQDLDTVVTAIDGKLR